MTNDEIREAVRFVEDQFTDYYELSPLVELAEQYLAVSKKLPEEKDKESMRREAVLGNTWRDEGYNECRISCILSILKALPKKKPNVENESIDFGNGWNACLKQIKENLGI